MYKYGLTLNEAGERFSLNIYHKERFSKEEYKEIVKKGLEYAADYEFDYLYHIADYLVDNHGFEKCEYEQRIDFHISLEDIGDSDAILESFREKLN